MRVHTYVIATDAGSAPNYDPPCVTLAVCKPRIRRKARVGDLIVAFTGRSVGPEPHAVCWAGVVTEILDFTQYWQDRRFATKKPNRSDVPDNFYKPDGKGGFIWITNPIHGPEALDHDTGGVNVLLFNPAWRFGAHGPILPEDFGLRMTGGRRGERLHDIPDVTWRRLESWLNAQPQLLLEAPTALKRTCSPSSVKRTISRRKSC